MIGATGSRPRRGAVLGLLAATPIVLTTAIAGITTVPKKSLPCEVQYTTGVRGGPLHIALGTDRRLYTTESTGARILRFDPNTQATKEFALPKGTVPHDIVLGPDGKLWFGTLNDWIGTLDPRTGKVAIIVHLVAGSQPHDLVWDHGVLYIAELNAGRIASYDPETGVLRDGLWGLPPNSQIHSLVEVPGGDLWATLSNANAIVRFDPRGHRVDKVVQMPIPRSGPRDMTYASSQRALYFTLFASNEFVRYDLRSGHLTLIPTGVSTVSLTKAESLAPGVEKLTFVKYDPYDDAVWSGTFWGELVRLDLRTEKTTRVYCGISFPAATAGITVDDRGRLWFNEAFPGRIARMRE